MKNEVVKKHNDLIQKARYSLSEVEIKIVSNLISMIRVDDKEFQQYQMDISQLQKLTGSKTKDREYYINIAKSLMSKPFSIENKVFNWVTYAEHQTNSNILKFEIHRNLKPYLLKLKRDFLEYNIKDILMLKSSYIIRLYELIYKEWKQYKHYNSNAKSFTFELELDYVRELFEIPSSQKYADIKRHIIDKAQKQFKEKTNIKFSYEEYKIGRAVKRLKIKVEDNIKGSNDPLSDLKSFIKWIRTEFKNVDLYHVPNKQCISVDNNGRLYDQYQKEIIDNKRSQDIWEKLYQLAKEDKLISIKQSKMEF